MALSLTGTLLHLERKSGVYNDRPYDFTQAHILDGNAVRKVRLPKGAHTLPEQFAQYSEVALPIHLSDDGTRMYVSEQDYAALHTAAQSHAA